jgi:hypothetical protein
MILLPVLQYYFDDCMRTYCNVFGYVTLLISSLCQEWRVFNALRLYNHTLQSSLCNYTTSTIFSGGQAKTLVFGFRLTLGFITKGFVVPLRSHLLPRYDFTSSAIRCSGNSRYK